MALAPMRVFELERVFIKIKNIDAVKQRFSATYYIEMRVRGSRSDKDFFKMGADGRTPINALTNSSTEGRTTVPSVIWYLENQIHWPNAVWQGEKGSPPR